MRSFDHQSLLLAATHRDRNYFPISPELARKKHPETLAEQRRKDLKPFSEDVITYRLEVDYLQLLWHLTKRTSGTLRSTSIVRHPEDERDQSVQVIVSHKDFEDISYRVEMCKCLAENNKNIQCLEKEILTFLVQRIP